MSGTILVKKSAWRETALTLLLSLLLSGGVTFAVLRRTHSGGLTGAAMSALLAYVIFRVLYPEAERLFGGGGQRISWSLTEEALTLGGRVIPRSAIRQVHCWPNRNALGISRGGYLVNIETDGRNELLCSLPEGAEAARSAEELRALVEALGYGSRWPSTPDGGPAGG